MSNNPKIVSLELRKRERESLRAKYSALMDMAGECFLILRPAIEEMRRLGVESKQIARILRVVMEDLEADATPPSGGSGAAA